MNNRNSKNRGKKKKIFITFLLGLMLSGAVSSQWYESNFIGLVGELGTDYVLAGWLINSLAELQKFFDSVYRNLPNLILANPPVESFSSGMGFFMNLIFPFYILGILVTSIYLLFLSSSPEGRAAAKGNLFKLIYSLILISFSPVLLKLLFLFSSTIAGFIMNVVDISIGINALEGLTDYFYAISIKSIAIYRDGAGGSSFWGAVLAFSYYLLYIVIMGRYVFITFFGMLLPLIMFLYSFYSTRGLGKTLLQQLLILVFIQITWAITLAVITIAVVTIQNYAVEIPEIYINFASYMVFFASPMMILGIMDWFVFVVFVIDSTTTGPLCVGPVVMDELYARREIAPEEITAPEYI
jgi:hypothetical protein